MTFDEILPALIQIFQDNPSDGLYPILINRDLNGRVCLILDEAKKNDSGADGILWNIQNQIKEKLKPHANPDDEILLYESDFDTLLEQTEDKYPLDGFENKIYIVDRMPIETNWSCISDILAGAPRIVFYSLKGGVGRSSALAAISWLLAEQGKKIMVIDLDLESPGLSSLLLPEDRFPRYGITDWLLEDLVDNADNVFEYMTSPSPLSRDGEITVVPAWGAEIGEYVAKVGRVWMPKLNEKYESEAWHERLGRLLNDLENKHKPDVVLIDSRSGIDEIASACITHMGASEILLFALDTYQNWTGYRAIFRHWGKTGTVTKIRERLQLVGAMAPDSRPEYYENLLEKAWNLFWEELYDELAPGEISEETNGSWNFDKNDDSAPHYPWKISWHQNLHAQSDFYGYIRKENRAEIQMIFEPLLERILSIIESTTEEN